MNVDHRKKELVQAFSPLLESTSKSTKIWIAFLGIVLVVGLYAFILQFIHGHVITGMRDNVVWGVYIVNFIFFICLSYSGAFISGILHFLNTPWKNSVSRIVELITVLSLIIGPIFILLCIGRLDRLHYLFIYPRIQSPITWDIIAIMTDLVGCFIYLYLTFIPDFAILRDHSKDAPKWKQKLYRTLAINYQATPEQERRLHRTTKLMSTMIIAMAIVAYTVLAWIFSLTLQPGWNSTIFAPYFIITGLYSGVAIIILILYLVRRFYRLNSYIKDNVFKVTGIVLLVMSMLYAYFTFSEYFPKWFSNRTQDEALLETLFTRYFWEFILANYIGVLIPIAILSYKKLRTPKWVTLAAIISIFGIWLNRYLIVVPTLETPFIPIQDTREEYIHYSATWIEWSLSFAGIAAFILIFIFIIKLVPVIPISGIVEDELKEEQKLNPKS